MLANTYDSSTLSTKESISGGSLERIYINVEPHGTQGLQARIRMACLLVKSDRQKMYTHGLQEFRNGIA